MLSNCSTVYKVTDISRSSSVDWSIVSTQGYVVTADQFGAPQSRRLLLGRSRDSCSWTYVRCRYVRLIVLTGQCVSYLVLYFDTFGLSWGHVWKYFLDWIVSGLHCMVWHLPLGFHCRIWWKSPCTKTTTTLGSCLSRPNFLFLEAGVILGDTEGKDTFDMAFSNSKRLEAFSTNPGQRDWVPALPENVA